MLDFIVVAEQHFILDAGVVLLQYGKDIRQPVDRHARKSPDADHTGLHPIHPVDLPHKLLMVVQNLAQKRHDLLTSRGQADAALASLQQRHTSFAFQVCDHFADGGLRVIELPCRAGKTALFHRFDKGEIFQ